METIKYEKIFCSEHPKEVIIRINKDPLAIKQLYCIDCYVNESNNKGLLKELIPVEEFISNAAEFYKAQEPVTASDKVEIPKEYIEFLKSQQEKISDLKLKLESEKKVVIDQIQEAIKLISEMLYRKKGEYLNMLDVQIRNYRYNIALIEKQIKKCYPSAKEPYQFPTLQELNIKFENIDSFYLLDRFVKEIKQDLQEKDIIYDNLEGEYTLSEARRLNLKSLFERVEATNKNIPSLKTDMDIKKALEPFSKEVDSLYSKIFALKNDIIDYGAVSKELCSVSRHGTMNKIEDKYNTCKTCNMDVCNGCKLECHKGHEFSNSGTKEFVCGCYMKRKECKKQTDCTFYLGKRTYYSQSAYRCGTCNMKSGQLVCLYCFKNCHAGHTGEFISTNGFCDCWDMFSFCKTKTTKPDWKAPS